MHEFLLSKLTAIGFGASIGLIAWLASIDAPSFEIIGLGAIASTLVIYLVKTQDGKISRITDALDHMKSIQMESAETLRSIAKNLENK